MSRRVEISLCHDVALALAHLHSVNITHRDLSSNNVLLIGPGSRAKVSDFGMSRVMDTSKSKYTTPLSRVPGTLVYMPPEALWEDPVYTEKLDCFSFGVLAIQIMTRLFPDPLPRSKRVESKDSPDEYAIIPVNETECRKNHIDMIDEANSLLDIAKECLSLKMDDRPQACQLCQKIEDLKNSLSSGDLPESLPTIEHAENSDLHKLRIENQHLEEEVSNMRRKLNETLPVQSATNDAETCRNCIEWKAIKESLEKEVLRLSKGSLNRDEAPPHLSGAVSIGNWKSGSPAPNTLHANGSTASFKKKRVLLH